MSCHVPLQQASWPFASTKLDRREIPVEKPTASLFRHGPALLTSLTGTFRHSGWKRHRIRRYLALNAAFSTFQSITAFATCGSTHWILRSKEKPDEFKVAEDTCKSKFCVPCARARANTIVDNLTRHLDDAPVRFVTFTLRHVDAHLDETLNRLYSSFRRVRQSKPWKGRVTGGVAFLEVKRSVDGRFWHPHLHCLVQGSYIPKDDLCRAWKRITGDSFIVDISLIRDRKRVLSYVTKYATKTASSDVEPRKSLLVELIQSVRSRRCVIAFGTWSKYKLLTPVEEPDWERYAHENELRYRASSGDFEAIEVLYAFEHRTDLIFRTAFDYDPTPD